MRVFCNEMPQHNAKQSEGNGREPSTSQKIKKAECLILREKRAEVLPCRGRNRDIGEETKDYEYAEYKEYAVTNPRV